MDEKCRNCNYCFEEECDFYGALCADAIMICENTNGQMFENGDDSQFNLEN